MPHRHTVVVSVTSSPERDTRGRFVHDSLDALTRDYVIALREHGHQVDAPYISSQTERRVEIEIADPAHLPAS